MLPEQSLAIAHAMTDEPDNTPSGSAAEPVPPPEAGRGPEALPPAEQTRHALRRKVIGWGAVAAVASALLALAANLSEIFGVLKPDDTRELVEQTRSRIEDTDQKVDELVTLLRNQAAVSGVNLDIESEAAIRNAVEAIVISGNREKQAALEQVNGGDVAGAAEALEKLARSQGEAAATTGATAADSWREAAALYETVDVEKAVASYEQAVAHRPDDPVLLEEYGHALVRAGRQEEGQMQFEAVLALEPEAAVRASALQGLGAVARQRGNYAEAAILLEQALDTAVASGNRAERIHALHALALLRRSQGDLDESDRLLGEALELAEEYDDDALRALVLSAIGSNAATAEDYESAVARLDEALKIYEAQDNVPRQAIVVGNLGAVALKRGDLEEAERLILESVRLGEQLKWRSSIAYDMINLAAISGAREQWDEADERLARAQQLATDTGLAELLPVIIFNRGEIAETAGDMDTACRHWAEATPLFVEMGSEHATVATEKLRDAGCPGTIVTE
jgi:tetratricopeptide (TPR) repeat protein